MTVLTLNTRILEEQVRPRRLHVLLGLLLLLLLQDVVGKQVQDNYSKQQVATSQRQEAPITSQTPRSQLQHQVQAGGSLDDALRMERDVASSEALDNGATEADDSYSADDSESSSSNPDGGDVDESTEFGSLPSSPATDHLRPSRQSAATTTDKVRVMAPTTSTPRQPISSSPVRLADSAEPASVTATRTPLQVISSRRGQVASEQSWTPTFNMDADRMIIKPPAGSNGEPTYSGEMSTEPTMRHELLSGPSNRLGVASHERRQDLLYPSNMMSEQPNSLGGRTEHPYLLSSGRPLVAGDEASDAGLSPMNVPNICYTPMALLTVILVTMSVTVLICFCTHLLMKHLGRHQFDLIRNSKLFEAKHGSGFLQNQQGAASYGDRRQFANRMAPASIIEHQSGCNNQLDDGKHPCMLGLLHRDQQHPASERNLQRYRDEHGCAFDNPYFKDDNRAHNNYPSATGALLMQPRAADNNLGLLTTATSVAATGDQRAESQQLNFIEHHISNLHNRQVTSSVKELSILGCETISTTGKSAHAAQVVDLTNNEQRARVLADPREGDLIAVEITGHDFIGLGFDVCGSQQEGIFIKTLQSRGPARESGCIQPGDRIKSVNISFDQVSLQDAFDILNSGSPYKMRLLLEKRSLSPKILEKMQSPSVAISPLANTHYKPMANYQGSQQYLMAGEQQVAPTSGGPLSTTKSYIRRLTNLVSSSSSSQNQVRPYEQPVYLGSAAARRNRLSAGLGGVPLGNMGSHSNAAFTNISDGEEASSNHQRRPRAGRRSLDSIEATFESTATTTQELAIDSSLDCYHTGNSNHRLHGPQIGSANWRQLDLRMVSSHDDATPSTKTNGGHVRRQSMATNVILSQQNHLEQTQSQPEIALKEPRAEVECKQSSMGADSLPRPMVNSASVPMMNLLTTGGDQVAATRHRAQS